MPNKQKSTTSLFVLDSNVSAKEDSLELLETSSKTKEFVRSCMICDKRLVGKLAFHQHLNQDHAQGSFSCPDCDQVFTSGSKLHEHACVKKHYEFTSLPPRHDLVES